MANTYFILRGKPENSKIYIRFAIDSNKKFTTKTELSVNKDEWEKTRNHSAEVKAVKNELTKLKIHLENKFNEDYTKGIIFTNQWLKDEVNRFFGRTEDLKDLNVFTNYIEEFIKSRTYATEFKSVTNQKYPTLLNKIKKFQDFKKKEYLLIDFDKKLFNEFRNWLIETNGLMLSTANRTLKNLKTVLRNAREEGYIVSPQLDGIKTPSIEGKKVFLSFEEIEQIKNTPLLGNNLNWTKDWLIIGCYLGQRVGDLLSLDRNMIYERTNTDGLSFEFIELRQEKTGNDVTIPLHYEVKNILKKYDDNFPPKFTDNKASNATIFNKYLKIVAEKSGINELAEGKVLNTTTKRHDIVKTEKYNLISSHVCRRSFATNFYGDRRFTTPQLMAITGHKTESIFLSYIGKNSSDHAMKTAETFAIIEEKKNII